MRIHYLENLSVRTDLPFMLFSHRIDGWVKAPRQASYADWDEVIEGLSKIIANIEFGGEWDLELYQVPSLDVKIRTMWGYYDVPRYGKKIATISYMNYFENSSKFFIDQHIIQVSSTYEDHHSGRTIVLKWK